MRRGISRSQVEKEEEEEEGGELGGVATVVKEKDEEKKMRIRSGGVWEDEELRSRATFSDWEICLIWVQFACNLQQLGARVPVRG